jgi:hypothetical protein
MTLPSKIKVFIKSLLPKKTSVQTSYLVNRIIAKACFEKRKAYPHADAPKQYEQVLGVPSS